eukprot:15361028-Ditylum_brightwellii.AAC.1
MGGTILVESHTLPIARTTKMSLETSAALTASMAWNWNHTIQSRSHCADCRHLLHGSQHQT